MQELMQKQCMQGERRYINFKLYVSHYRQLQYFEMGIHGSNTTNDIMIMKHIL